MNERISVFVSGTHVDLKNEREAVRKVLDCFEVSIISMETFGSHAKPSLEVCLSKVAESDLVIVVVGHRLGSTINDGHSHVSYTQKEFECAVDNKIPIHAYIKRDDVPVLPAHVEHKHWHKLLRFKKQLTASRDRLAAYYKDPMDLAIMIAADLSRFLRDRSRIDGQIEGIPHTRTSDDEFSPKPRVVVCRIFGNPWPRLTETLEKAEWEFEFLDTADGVDAALQGPKVVIIPGSGFRREALDTDDEAIKKLSTFVENGGGLLCVGQAWSWVEPRYGNKPLENFPLNKLGKKLGFEITERTASIPDQTTIDKKLQDSGVTEVIRDGRWSASEIISLTPSAEVLFRDTKGRSMAVEISHGKGRLIVAGHEAMLEQNPLLLDVFLHNLRGDPGVPAVLQP